MRYLPLQNRLSPGPLGALPVVDIRVRATQGVQGEQAGPAEVVSTQVVDEGNGAAGTVSYQWVYRAQPAATCTDPDFTRREHPLVEMAGWVKVSGSAAPIRV